MTEENIKSPGGVVPDVLRVGDTVHRKKDAAVTPAYTVKRNPFIIKRLNGSYAYDEHGQGHHLTSLERVVEALRGEYVMTAEQVKTVGGAGFIESLKGIAAGGEVRTVSATGGEKGSKLAQMSALDPNSLLIVAEVAGFGAQKYAKLNFMKGYDWSLSYDALQRHLHAFWSGQDIDDESGMSHLGHAAWHCLTLLSFIERGLGTDDRYTSTELSELQTKTPAR